MGKVYAVVGEHGSYSDWTTWIVCAYPEREMAEKHVEMLKPVVAEFTKKYQEWLDGSMDTENPADGFHPDLDPKGSWSGYDENEYTVQEIPMFVHVDQLFEVG